MSRDLRDDERWVAAISSASMAAPTLVDAMTLMTPFHSDKERYASIDGSWRVAVGDGFFSLESAQKDFLIIHLCMHRLCMHFERAESAGIPMSADALKAMDMEIDHQIMLMDVERIPEYPIPEDMGLKPGRSMEEYYHAIHKESSTGDGSASANEQAGEKDDKDSKPGDGMKPGHADDNDDDPAKRKPDNAHSGKKTSEDEDTDGKPSGKTDGDGDGDASAPAADGGMPASDDPDDAGGKPGEDGGEAGGPADDGNDADPAEDDGDNSGAGGGAGSSGSGAGSDGGDSGCERTPDDVGMDADVNGVEPPTPSEMVESVREVRRIASSGGYSLGSSGDGPLSMLIVKHSNPPKTNWRRVLSRIASSARARKSYQATEHTYSKINARASAFFPDTIFPGMTSYEPKIIMALDTSGSMGQDRILKALAEAEGIIKSGSGSSDFSIFCVDTKAKAMQPVDDITKLDLTGGGGTDMAPAFEYIRSLSAYDRPDVFVLATDGYVPWERCQDLMPSWACMVIILIVDEGGMKTVPSWLESRTEVLDISS